MVGSEITVVVAMPMTGAIVKCQLLFFFSQQRHEDYSNSSLGYLSTVIDRSLSSDPGAFSCTI